MKRCIKHLFAVLVLLTLTAALYAQTLDDLNPGADAYVYATAIQPDGKIVLGGAFSTLAGQPRSGIGRLNPDGALDNDFNPGASGWGVFCLAVQPDGKIVVAGGFAALGGQLRSNIGRLNSDGTLDTAFGAGIDGTVFCLAVQADGKILVGAEDTSGSRPRYELARFNGDGTLDTGFNPAAVNRADSLAVQPDGRILVGGLIATEHGAGGNGIVRLNADGSLETGFDSVADGTVWSLALQRDGKIVVGGNFSMLNGQSRSYIGRLNSDGTLDRQFNPGADYCINSLALQSDGKILVGGHFWNLGGQPRNDIGRLNADGTLDPTFNQGTAGVPWQYISSLALQADGKVVLAGGFLTLAGQSRAFIGRFNNTDEATQALTRDATSITWLRGGTSPEIGRATFDASTNGVDWDNLGGGTRIVGGWQLTGVAVPAEAIIRARGYVTGGRYNASAWFTESLLKLPVLLSQPISQTNTPGSVVTFNVTAAGIAPLSFQWRKDEVNLDEGGNVSGVQTPTLTLSNVALADEGGYSVVISNHFGSVTSAVATLTVLDPFIASQPLSQNADAGGTATLSVTALGTAPLGYQWRKDGVEVVDATAASLTLTNVQKADAGGYDVVVSNGSGTVTSMVAQLTVNLARVDAFDPNAQGTVYTTAIEVDGSILMGGAFQMSSVQVYTNGQAYTNSQAHINIARLDPQGTLDTNFNANVNGTVDTLAVQADGKILVGGSFTYLDGQWRLMIGRLNSDGTLDSEFNPGASSPVYCLAPQADGKILVGGAFIELSGQLCTNLGRLNPDGTLDSTFRAGADGSVFSLAVQADGMILVGGGFTKLNGQPRAHLGRLLADGTLDSTFDPEAGDTVSGLAVQADGKILVGGYFLTLGGQPRNYIARLNSDGSLDDAFNPGADDYVYSVAVQADGKIQVGGNFTRLGGQARNRLGRLNKDSTLDLTFNPGASGCVYSLAQETDGTTLVGGSFTTLGGQPRNGLGRLGNTDPAMHSLVCGAGDITWLRGGSSPEVWCASVEVSTNGNDWTSLGAGKRIAGGWQFTGVSATVNANIRARGLAKGGQYNRSSWVVETKIVTSLPQILSQPLSQTNYIGTDASFSVVAGGTPPLSYHWLKDGTNIADATAPVLTLTNVQPSAQGSYSVVVSNALGSTASVPACLVVNQPTCRFTSVGFESNGLVKVQFFAPAGLVCVVGASTNLVTWEVIGLAKEQADGTFVFEDVDAAQFPYRYYRIQE